MPMTVRRLAATTSLGLTIVAGHDDVDLSISWAHAIELQDPTRWLAGGELVMTTGLHLPRSATKQYEYVERIAQTGAVGTGVRHRHRARKGAGRDHQGPATNWVLPCFPSPRRRRSSPFRGP